MSEREADPALRRFEHDAVLACLVTAALGFAAGAAVLDLAQGVAVGLGVLGGGFLMGVSYRAIKGGVDVLASIAVQARQQPHATEEGAEPDPSPAPVLSPGRRAWLVVKFFTRYALLAVAAYVMLTCFRLHPLGLVAGALAPFLAGVVQIGRLSRARARRLP